MTARVCSAPGCPRIVRAAARGGRCQGCERAYDQARGTRQERGYDADYDRVRLAYQRRMDDGEAFTCWRCEELGRPHRVDPARWHLGHDNDDRTVIRGPQCPDSNLADAQRAARGVGVTPLYHGR